MSGILSRAARLAGPLWFALQDYSVFRNCSVLDTDLGLFLQCLQTRMGAERKKCSQVLVDLWASIPSAQTHIGIFTLSSYHGRYRRVLKQPRGAEQLIHTSDAGKQPWQLFLISTDRHALHQGPGNVAPLSSRLIQHLKYVEKDCAELVGNSSSLRHWRQ